MLQKANTHTHKQDTILTVLTHNLLVYSNFFHITQRQNGHLPQVTMQVGGGKCSWLMGQTAKHLMHLMPVMGVSDAHQSAPQPYTHTHHNQCVTPMLQGYTPPRAGRSNGPVSLTTCVCGDIPPCVGYTLASGRHPGDKAGLLPPAASQWQADQLPRGL